MHCHREQKKADLSVASLSASRRLHILYYNITLYFQDSVECSETGVQWNLKMRTPLGPIESVLIREVS